MERTEQQNRLAKEDGSLNEGRTRQEERRRISIVLNPRCAYETSSARLATPHAHTATSPLGYVLNEHRERYVHRVCSPQGSKVRAIALRTTPIVLLYSRTDF